MTKTLKLTDRLRGIYTIPVNDGAGLLDGKDTFTRNFETTPIQHEAADVIEALVGAMKGAMHYVAEYESSHESNAALDVYTACREALAKAGAA